MGIADSYIDCRFGNMRISHGNAVNELTLYPPAKPTTQQEFPLWTSEEEPKQADQTLHLYMIEQSLIVKQPTEGDLIIHFLTNSIPSLDFRELFNLVCVT